MSTTPTDVDPTRVLTLKSSDGELFQVIEKMAVQSEIVKQMVEDGCTGDAIPLHNVTAKVLSMVLEWCNKHEDEHKHKDGKENKELEKWEKEFMDRLQLDDLHDLLLAANYLNIKALLHCSCQRVADMIKEKKPEEIRKMFGIQNDFTPEEEEEIRRENSWAFQ